jgi:hypothetical protein
MTDPTNRPPLWQVMHNAYSSAAGSPTEGPNYAAELRVIADEMAARMRLLEEGYNLTAAEVISWLRDEADRAEAVE